MASQLLTPWNTRKMTTKKNILQSYSTVERSNAASQRKMQHLRNSDVVFVCCCNESSPQHFAGCLQSPLTRTAEKSFLFSVISLACTRFISAEVKKSRPFKKQTWMCPSWKELRDNIRLIRFVAAYFGRMWLQSDDFAPESWEPSWEFMSETLCSLQAFDQTLIRKVGDKILLLGLTQRCRGSSVFLSRRWWRKIHNQH